MSSKKQNSPTDESSVYQLKITLKRVSPPIWRRIQVPGSVNLTQLHEILNATMGWTATHLHQFVINKTFYGEPDADGVDYPYSEVENGKKYKLNQIVPSRPKFKFIYEYDFGDGWEHEVFVEDILPMESDKIYPLCLAGKRECPKEDCGGPEGYEQLLKSFKKPNNPDYRDALEWLGEDFDPEAFNLEEKNEILTDLGKDFKLNKIARSLVAVK